MMTPADAIAYVLARLQRRRRGQAEPPVTARPPTTSPAAKPHRFYWDKALRARADYETKEGQ